MTRIWQQSVTDLELLPHYREHLRAHARRVTGPDTTVDVHGMAPGTYPAGVPPIEALRYPAVEHLLGTQLLAAAGRAEREGYDAVAVGCFFDPVIDELRAAVDIPVLTLAQSSLLMAGTAGSRFALLAIAPVNNRRLVELVGRYGFTERVSGVVDVEPAITEDELDAAFTDVSGLLGRLEDAARRAAGDGADLLIPAENVLNSLLVGAGVRELAGLPVLDAYGALLVHAEAAVAMRRRTGLQTGRTGAWARAPRAVLEAAATRADDALRHLAGPDDTDEGARLS